MIEYDLICRKNNSIYHGKIINDYWTIYQHPLFTENTFSSALVLTQTLLHYKMVEKGEDLAFNQKFLLSAFRGKVTFIFWSLNSKLLGFDKNGDGKISVPEFLETMRRSGKISERHIQELLKQGDIDGDG